MILSLLSTSALGALYDCLPGWGPLRGLRVDVMTEIWRRERLARLVEEAREAATW